MRVHPFVHDHRRRMYIDRLRAFSDVEAAAGMTHVNHCPYCVSSYDVKVVTLTKSGLLGWKPIPVHRAFRSTPFDFTLESEARGGLPLLQQILVLEVVELPRVVTQTHHPKTNK